MASLTAGSSPKEGHAGFGFSWQRVKQIDKDSNKGDKIKTVKSCDRESKLVWR